MMFYIHQLSCISPQYTFSTIELDDIKEPVNKQLIAIEPTYDSIPAGLLRRMGKAVRMGVGAALPILKRMPPPNGIIIGTANCGKEDCVKFLNQVIEYDEGLLTPINFVQSTSNALAAQIGLLSKNHNYNITHVHLGLSFEYSLIDADMLLQEFPSNHYLVGSIDDTSTYHYYFEDKAGSYKKEPISNKDLYNTNTPGCIAGEAAVMFHVNGIRNGAVAKIIAVDTLHSTEVNEVGIKFNDFLRSNLPAAEKIDLLVSGENGDNRLEPFYNAVASTVENSIARFKHLSGEFPTATAMAVWLSCELLMAQSIPENMILRHTTGTKIKNIVIYNNYKGLQHSFILLSLP